MSNPDLKLVENERAHRRVSVALRGALCIPGTPITLVHTNNISEGGIAVVASQGRLPKVGSSVKLQLDGVLSNGPDRKFDIYAMKVVYANRKSIGLAFDNATTH
ncbi:MAG: PilZ domain-containing protein [Pseudomonadales bacterium]|nr:PilZ domain-containing protein [Gammaproteobacteria bacterium]NNL56620.1 PilZ domain-containing protein [Pseudomonadales bacterium]